MCAEPHRIIAADPTLRRMTLVAIVVVTVVGAAGLVYTGAFLERVQALASDDPEEAAQLAARTFKVLTVFMAVVPIIVGAYLGQVAVRAWHHAEFPPPGTRVLRDTIVTVGPRSRRWALLAFVIALLLVGSSIFLPLWSWQLTDRLFTFGGPPFTP